ncbi:Crp/Fnr family transcriptional regulator [Pedobacter namyangjuensis]|uniref:Crp/Fnr family transcriptional regulator n=1 Tax=Pedobacter namyangjuensis TaxID=600626 RepID=UPI0013B378C7|nr:Crp/Fnr family transcriptional regulator [Pedobacter namyangjuensis]
MERHDIPSSLAHLTGIAQESIQGFARLFQPIELDRNQVLCGPGQNGRSIYLLTRGLLHHYRKSAESQAENDNIHQDPTHDKAQSNQTLNIYLPGSYIGSPARLLAPSQLDYVTALGPSILLATSQLKLQGHCLLDPDASQLLFAIQQATLQNQLRLIEMLHLQPAGRRQQVMSENLGDYLGKIPRQVLASYLALSRKHLGRLIREQKAIIEKGKI